MRQLINNYSFTAGTRQITLGFAYQVGVHNIRLIVNETQKFVICSSMQKDNISISNNVITYTNDLPELASGDTLTIELDWGEDLNASMNDIILRTHLDGCIGADNEFMIDGYLADTLTELLSVDAATIAANGKSLNLPSDLFRGTHVKSISMPRWTGETSLPSYVGNNMFANCTKLVSISFPSLKKLDSYGGFVSMFSYCTALEYVEFPELESLPGRSCFNNAFSGCSNLKEISFPKLKSITTNSGASDVFSSCPNLKTATLHPDNLCPDPYVTRCILSSNFNYNATNVPPIEHLYLSANASKNLDVKFLPYLDFNSVKNVLEHCANANMSGKTITFYSGGLTVQDDADGTLQTLYNSVVTTYDATIANLTITPYSA